MSTKQNYRPQFYASAAAFCAAVESPARCSANAPDVRRVHASGENRSKWSGGTPYADMLALMRTGWPEGAARVSKELRALRPVRLASVKRRPQWADQGDELCRDKVYSGQLDTAWRRCKPRNHAAPPAVRVVIDVCVNADVDRQALFWKAAAGLSLAQSLVTAGYNVELAAAMEAAVFTEPAQTLCGFIMLKPAQARYSPAHLAAVCNPSFFPMLGITWILKAAEYSVGSGIGRARVISEEHARGFNAPSVVFIAGAGIGNQASAQKWIDQQRQALESGKGLAARL